MIRLLRSRNGVRWFLVDLLFGFIAFFLALRLTPHPLTTDVSLIPVSLGFAICVALSAVFVGVPVVGRDHEAPLYEVVVMSFVAIFFAAMSFSLLSSLLFFTIFGRYILLLAMVMALLFMILFRCAVFLLHRDAPLKIFLVGAIAQQVEELSSVLSDSSAFSVVCASLGTDVPGVDPISLSDHEWEKKLLRRSVNTVVLCTDKGLSENESTALLELPLHGMDLYSYGSFMETFFKRLPVRYMSPKEVAAIHVCSSHDPGFFAKRVVDVLVSLIGLVITLPIWVFVAIAIKWDSKGPVFFVQERDGLGETTFSLVKFRTMSGEASPQTDDDHRITRTGRFLRKTRLDELPQLLNILKGDMALVGPRPEYSGYTKEFQEKIPHYAYRRLIRPGLTGWAQIRYRYSTTWQEVEQKLQYDLYYIRHVSFQLDMCILIKTLPLLMKGSR